MNLFDIINKLDIDVIDTICRFEHEYKFHVNMYSESENFGISVGEPTSKEEYEYMILRVKKELAHPDYKKYDKFNKDFLMALKKEYEKQ